MPLAAEYGDQVKSKIADLKNVGGRPGSSITAALFLKEFVEKVRGCNRVGVAQNMVSSTAPTKEGVKLTHRTCFCSVPNPTYIEVVSPARLLDEIDCVCSVAKVRARACISLSSYQVAYSKTIYLYNDVCYLSWACLRLTVI